MMFVAPITFRPQPRTGPRASSAALVPRTLAAAAMAVGSLLGPASSQAGPSYPERPVQLIAQQPPGSQSEAISRIWAECASRELGQPVVVISKPGANGVVATNYLKAQPADGYTLMTAGMSQLTITPFVYRHPPYDPVKDFDGIAVLSTSPLFLVASVSSGIRELRGVASIALRAAGGVNYGSPGKGSPAHLLTAAVLRRLQVEGTHVPYIGEAAGVRALLAGEIGIMTLTAGTAGPLIKVGRVFPLAIYAASRDERFSQVPTIGEITGDNTLALPGWLALVAKPGTPAPVTKLLREVTAKCARSDPQYRLRLAQMNASPVDPAASDVPTWLRRYTGQFKPLIEQLQIAE